MWRQRAVLQGAPLVAIDLPDIAVRARASENKDVGAGYLEYLSYLMLPYKLASFGCWCVMFQVPEIL